MEKNNYGFPTGSHETIEKTKIIDYEFSPFNIKIKVGDFNQFIEITEVGLSKSFLNERSNQVVKSTHDIEEFYK